MNSCSEKNREIHREAYVVGSLFIKVAFLLATLRKSTPAWIIFVVFFRMLLYGYFCIRISIARLRVKHDQQFPYFEYFVQLIHKPLGE